MQALLDAICGMDFPTDAKRVFHGRGGLHPGSDAWTLDAFPPAFVLTRFASPSDDEAAQLTLIGTALAERWSQIAPGHDLTWVFQRRNEREPHTQLMAGVLPDPLVVTEQGALFRVQLERGQNHGLFLDMASGRAWVRQHVAEHCARHPRGPKVLNLFAYTCAFSVVALQSDARKVVNVDMSRGAMAVGQQNHQQNGLGAGASFLVHDIFSTWGKINRSGPYDLVIVDPPSYQKGSFVATKDYARLMRRLPDLVAPGGHALLCLNAPELNTAFLKDQMRALAPELHFVERLANPASFADSAPERALKALVFQAAEGAPSQSVFTTARTSAAPAC